MKNILVQLLIGVSLLAFAGCQGNEQTVISSTTQEQDSAAQSNTPSTDGKGKGDTMIASVNGTKITSEEVELETANLMMQYQGNMPPEQLQQMQPQIKKQALESLINKALLFIEAKQKNITPDTQQIDDEIKSIAGRFPSQEEFQSQMAKAGMNENELRDKIGQNLMIDTLLKDKLQGIETAGDDEISAFYNKNRDDFNVPEQVQARHILLKFNPGDSQEVKSQKRLDIAGLRGQIEKGTDFAELARNHSECPSKERGGDLGYFGKGQMVKPFEDTAFTLGIGEVSEVVETEFGLHIIKLMDKKEPHMMPLEEVKDKIADYLKSEKEKQAVGGYLSDLRAGAQIEYAQKEQ